MPRSRATAITGSGLCLSPPTPNCKSNTWMRWMRSSIRRLTRWKAASKSKPSAVSILPAMALSDRLQSRRNNMIDKILEFSLRQRAFVLLGAFALLGLGLWSAVKLPIDAVPDITGGQVTVDTEVPALAGEESERLVTRPIEIELAGLPGVEEMRSLTKFGLSQVTLQFADGTDIYRARQLVAERLQTALEKLPQKTSPKLTPISTGLGEICYYSFDYKAG